MIRTLSAMYEPVFGPAAQVMLLVGAFAVLYSTFLVSNAAFARVFPDALRVMRIVPGTEVAYRRWVRIFGGVFPYVCLTVYLLVQQPVRLILFAGLVSGTMLPLLAIAALHFRYSSERSTTGPRPALEHFLMDFRRGNRPRRRLGRVGIPGKIPRRPHCLSSSFAIFGEAGNAKIVETAQRGDRRSWCSPNGQAVFRWTPGYDRGPRKKTSLQNRMEQARPGR